MKRKSVLVGAVMILMVVTASMVFLADFGRVGAAQDLEVKRPPEPEPCNCPQNYEPVVCRASDGSLYAFPNACFAGCAGYAHCARYEPRP